MKAATKLYSCVFAIVFLSFSMIGCGGSAEKKEAAAETEKQSKEPVVEKVNIIFLHHSTGNNVWKGGVPQWIEKYSADNGKDYQIIERNFPSGKPYSWKNYPFDYWNIWVKNAGSEPFMEEPTLEMLTPKYNVIIFKHCYPVSNVMEDTGNPDINSEEKRIENYKLHYEALKTKLRTFPKNEFIVWTGAAQVEGKSNEENGKRARKFFEWVKNEWDEKGDNIYVWDLFELQTDGGLFLKDEYAKNPKNSHPNEDFCKTAAPLFAQRIVDVIEGKGDQTSLTGK